MNDRGISGLADGDREPWLADRGRFLRANDPGYIAGILQYLKDNHVPLTLVVDGGGIPRPSLVIDISKGSVQIDKPLEWDAGTGSFRVFYRDMGQMWSFFSVYDFSVDPFRLVTALPDELFFLQKRACPRVAFPPGTRALIKRDNQAMSTVFVHDLSSAGMLICNDPADGEYDRDSIISDIVVSIPARSDNGRGGSARKVLPLISRGQIVRSYRDQETMRPCYGVSFQHDSRYVEETIGQVVAEVERAG